MSATSDLTKKSHRVFLAGDALITKPWSGVDDRAFLDLVGEMRQANTTIINLETLIHEYKGYAQAHSGGAYMTSPPEIATELKWADVNMVSHANNHAFDYGAEGIIETHENIGGAGIVIAGTGVDLQSARAPKYFDSNNANVALVSMASTFISYGAASRGRADLHGRPGLNPLTLLSHPTVNITRKQALRLSNIATFVGRGSDKYLRPQFTIHGIEFLVSECNRLSWGLRASPKDVNGNLLSIERAASKTDLSVVAMHAHRQGRWLRHCCHGAIEKGADVVFVHGPHRVCGIELYLSKPIFYCMGDYVYQSDQISRGPSEAYERVGLSEQTTIEEFHGNGRRFTLQNTRDAYEGFAVTLDYVNGKLDQIRAIPVDLQFDAKTGTRGRPRWAQSEAGRRIIAKVSEK